MSDSDAPIHEKSFVIQLIGDVIEVNARLTSQDTPSHRRDVVRTTFAAIEGMVWLMREHVRTVANDWNILTPMIDMALREATYSVNERGQVIEQVKFVTLPSILRLAVSQAQEIDKKIDIDFGDQAWASFRHAIAIRNKATHPKFAADLLIDDGDLDSVRLALSWLLSVVEKVMMHTTAAHASFVQDSKILLDALKNGETWALELYYREISKSESSP